MRLIVLLASFPIVIKLQLFPTYILYTLAKQTLV